MTPEIDKAIDQIEAKIAALERARATLIETFCPPDSARRRALAAQRPTPAAAGAAFSDELDATSGMRFRRRRTRKDIVAEFIRRYGPSTRAEILAGAGIPPGSVAFALNDKSRFVLEGGRWRNVGEAPLPAAEGPAAPDAAPSPVQEPQGSGPGADTPGATAGDGSPTVK